MFDFEKTLVAIVFLIVSNLVVFNIGHNDGRREIHGKVDDIWLLLNADFQ